jgi:hypothetical protein
MTTLQFLTDTERLALTPGIDGYIFSTDTRILYYGDGVTPGGISVSNDEFAAFQEKLADLLTVNTRDLSLNGYNITGAGNIYSSGLVVSGNSSLTLSSSNRDTLNVTGITTGAGGGIPTATFASSKGTLDNPTITGPGDQLFVVSFTGLTTKSLKDSTAATALVASWDTAATMTNSTPGGVFKIGVPNNNSGFNFVTFTGITGVLNSPINSTTVYSATTTPLPSASTVGAGARAFVSDAMANTFGTAYTSGGTYAIPVYSDGTAWYIG